MPPFAAAPTPVAMPTRPPSAPQARHATRPASAKPTWTPGMGPETDGRSSAGGRRLRSGGSAASAGAGSAAEQAEEDPAQAGRIPHFFFTVPTSAHGHHAQPFMSMTSAAGYPTGHAPKPRHFQCRGCGGVGTSVQASVGSATLPSQWPCNACLVSPSC